MTAKDLSLRTGILLTILLSSSIAAFRISGHPLLDSTVPGVGQRSAGKRANSEIEAEANGTQFIWTILDTYDGSNFFE